VKYTKHRNAQQFRLRSNRSDIAENGSQKADNSV